MSAFNYVDFYRIKLKADVGTFLEERMIDNKPFITSQNMATLLVRISKNIVKQAQVPASSNERLEKLVNELKSCADFVLELSDKEIAQEQGDL